MEMTIAEQVKAPDNVTFSNDEGEEVGKLTREDGIFAFEGKAEESAKVFFRFLKGLFPTGGQ